MPAVHFINEHKSIDVLPGSNLRKAALRSGVQLYRPIHRVFHLNLKLGPVAIPCSSDVVEIVDAKGVNARTQDEEALIAGRFIKHKVGPSMRLACQVIVNGDITVRTLPDREMDMEETKKTLGYLFVLGVFFIFLLGMFALMALDLVKEL